MSFWHGGVPGLRPGDLVKPGHDRKHHDGCRWCEARARERAGGVQSDLDPLALHSDRVYITTHRLYAKHYASLWGRGWLYRVAPVGDVVRSSEDSFETYAVPAARILSIYERAVLLTMSERRRLFREWSAADAAHEGARS